MYKYIYPYKVRMVIGVLKRLYLTKFDVIIQGVAFIDGKNIGTYQPEVGSQITLYVPAPYLVPGSNTIVMVELWNI